MAKKKTKAKKRKSKKKTTAKVLTPSVWRDPDGHFKKGNPGGPGRPFLREERFLVSLNEAVTPAKWDKVVKQAITDAIAGDRYARDWLSKYLIGQPREAIPIDEKRAIIDVLTDRSFLDWYEAGGNHDGRDL